MFFASYEGKKQRNRIRTEEAHHAITQMGYAVVYLSVFGLSTKSTLVKECNKATCDWWTHPENKCLKKKPLIKFVEKCTKKLSDAPNRIYSQHNGKPCTASENKETCKEASCNCMEWYHQVS